MKETPQDYYIFVENAEGFAEALAEGENGIMVGDEPMIMKEVNGNRITVCRYVIEPSPQHKEVR